jgi:hypothetical protein
LNIFAGKADGKANGKAAAAFPVPSACKCW